MASSSTPTRIPLLELERMASAPDLTRSERRDLQRTIRFQRRVETWEARRQGPQPRKLHRAVITLLMMAACLFVLFLIVQGPTS